MITLLLGLFVILYATSKVDQVKFEQVAASLQRAFDPQIFKGPTATSVVNTGNPDTRPLSDNTTPEGRARNRRVEIWIGNPEPIGPSAAPNLLSGPPLVGAPAR